MLDAGATPEEALREAERSSRGWAMAVPPANGDEEALGAEAPEEVDESGLEEVDREAPTRAARRPRGRRLVADFLVGDRPERRALPPQTDVLLVVWVGVPERGQPAGEVDVELPDEPGRESVVLDVTVAGTPWPTPQTRQVSVPLRSTRSGTRAVFELRTPAAGQVVDVQVTLSHRGRPLQVGAIAAPVRTRPVPGDAVTLTARATSSGPLPAPGLLHRPGGAAVTVDARGAELVTVSTGAKVPQADVTDLLEGLGLTLSRVLGSPFAPTGLLDESARALLVDLARKGALLRERLDPLGIGDATELNVLVLPHGSLFPLEVAYDGPAPERSAEVCSHATGTPCAGPSVRRVCPYAFWGASRAICRVVQVDRWTSEPLERVRLAPLLFAAAARADAGPPAPPPGSPAPSDDLFADLRGAAPDPVRVTSWTAWRRAVRERSPGLLVLLAHTEATPGDHVLEIGRRSTLALADVRTAHLAPRGAAAPLVVLVACSTSQARDPYGSFHGVLVNRGAAAVVGTLGQLNGVQGARAAEEIVRALRATADSGEDTSLGAALTRARRALLADGLLVGLLLVSHGEIAATVAA